MRLSFHIEPLAIVVAFSVLQRAWGTPPKYMDDSRSTEGKNYQAEYVKEYVRDESNFIVSYCYLVANAINVLQGDEIIPLSIPLCLSLIPIILLFLFRLPFVPRLKPTHMVAGS